MAEKTHWKKLINPKYLGAYSLDGKPEITITISKVVREQVEGDGGRKEECTVAYIKNQKPLILNNTNCKTIQKIYDTAFIEEWAGKKITLYVAKINAFGESNVECLRIRKEIPVLPSLTPQSDKWAGAVTALKNGAVSSVDAIKKQYQLTSVNEKKLIDESK